MSKNKDRMATAEARLAVILVKLEQVQEDLQEIKDISKRVRSLEDTRTTVKGAVLPIMAFFSILSGTIIAYLKDIIKF